jgi:hypothetical protein
VAEAELLPKARNLVKHNGQVLAWTEPTSPRTPVSQLISRRLPLSSWPDALTRQPDDVKVAVDLRD